MIDLGSIISVDAKAYEKLHAGIIKLINAEYEVAKSELVLKTILPVVKSEETDKGTYKASDTLESYNFVKPVYSLPAITEKRYSQCRQLVALVSLLEMKQEQAMQKVREGLLAGVKVPAVTIIEKTSETDPSVIYWREHIIVISLLRDQFIGILKGLDLLNQQIKFEQTV